MKKAISILLALAMMLTLLPMSALAAETAVTFTVDNVNAQPGGTVDVSVTITHNVGVLSANLEFTFGDELTLIAAEAGDAFDPEKIPVTMPAQLLRGESVKNIARFMWQGTSITDADVKDGLILTMTFEIDENAAADKEHKIGLRCLECCDRNADDLETETVSGYVTLIDYLPGDANSDKKISTKDVIWISRYIVDGCTTDPDGYNVAPDVRASNVNGDTKISTKDVIWISRYIVDGLMTDPEGYNIQLLPAPILCAHDMEAFPAKDATCEEDGNIAYWYCSKCGKYFTDVEGKGRIELADTVIPALGHDVVVDPYVEPTYTSCGWTEGSHCARCGKVFVERQRIDPLTPNTKKIIYKIVNEAEHPYLATINIDRSALIDEYTPGQTVKLVNLDLGKYGYTFDGWFDGFGKNATQIKEIPASSNEDVTVYAHVTEIQYDITYNMYLTPVTSSPTEEQMHYTVSKGNSNLYNPEINNYKFLGWYDNNGVEYKTIPVGSTGNIVLNTYYTSLRNLAISKEDKNPIILEDQNNNVVYFTYEIGEIRNIPLNADKPFWSIQSVAGLSQQRSETFSTSISKEEADSISKIISDMTVNSSTFTLAENWNDVTTVNEAWAQSIGKTAEQCKTEATTSSNTLSISDQMGGSSYHKTEDGTTVYDYDSKTETKDKGHQFNASLSGSYTNKLEANLGASNEYGATGSYGYTEKSKGNTQTGSASASDKDTYSSGISYSNGFEVNAGLSYGYHNNTNTVTKTGTDKVSTSSNIDESTASWNCSATASSTNQHSISETVRNTLSDIVTTTKEYGKTYSSGGSDAKTQGFSSTASNTSGTTSTITYSKLESRTTTTTYSVDGKIEGRYRNILVGKAHVFGVVGYDYNTKSYFTYTFSVMDDKVEEFLDYTPKGSDFDDCEFCCLPFEVPYYVFEYVNEKTVKTSGISYRTDSVNGIATITGYSGMNSDVIIPSYVSDGKQAYKVTNIASSAFAGKSIRSIVLGEFIKVIPDGAFKNCANLEEIIGSFTEIGNEAFWGCSNLTNMNIPSNVVRIGKDAFVGVASINVRAINSLSAYAEAVKALPNGTDTEIEAARKTITANYIQSVLNCGAQNITLDISRIVEGTPLNLEVPFINSLKIDGGGKTYGNFALNSHAKFTSVCEMTIENTNAVPLTADSDKLSLRKVFASSNIAALIFKKDGAELSLNQDSTLKSTSTYAVISKNPVITSSLSSDGADGFLNISGNFGYVNSISGEQYVEIRNGKFVKITEDEFDKYIKGSITVTFDPNGGTVGTNSLTAYIGSKIGTLPTPKRDHYVFDGWFTKRDGGTQITSEWEPDTVGDITLYAHWSVLQYTAKWSAGANTTIKVERTSSPYANAQTGTISSGATVYYGDVLKITYSAATGYSLATKGKTSITVTGNVTSSDIYATATANTYIYYIVYESVNGTDLGSSTVSGKYGESKTVTAPAKSGYTTPPAQTVKFDSTSPKTITFKYGIVSQPTSQEAASGWWWQGNSSGSGVSFVAYVEYQNRTANTVQIRIRWVQSIKSAAYGYNQWFYASCGEQNTGDVKIASTSTWPYYSSSGPWHTGSVTAYSGWMTVPVSATNTSVTVGCDWWQEYSNPHRGSWWQTVSIPAY